MESHLFGRSTTAVLPRAAKGDGCYIFDQTGKRYFDGSGGAAVSCLGHSDPDVRAAIHHQVDAIAFAHTGFFSSDPAEELADLLVENAPQGLNRVYLVSGGSEAVEASLKLARQYFLEIGQPDRHRIIARRQSYHGNTLGALAAGGNLWRRKQFAPLLAEVSHIAPCYEYRGRLADESALAYGRRVADELESEILRLGPETVMAFVVEPVVGATLGAVPAVEGYLQRIREICTRYGVLMIADEVMCGMGRTGHLFACAEDGISPDILCIAKGLGAGYQPIGAMMCSEGIFQAIRNGSGFFQHGHTYMGHPVAAAAACAVLKAIRDRNLLTQVRARGAQLAEALSARLGQHPHVGDIRGRGLFRGIELVADRESKTPFDPKLGVHKKVKAAAFEAGLICYPMGGTIDGQSGDHILLAPPFIMAETQISEIVEPLAWAIDRAIT